MAAENLGGHATVRATSPISIQSGENWWFPRGFAEAIAAGASASIMPDLMKVGGVTGWLRVAGQAEAASIPMSSHLFAEASAHMLAVTPTAHWLEFLDLARTIVAEPVESSTARSPRGVTASGCRGMRRRSRNIWCERPVVRHRPRRRTIQYSVKLAFRAGGAAYWMPRLRGA